MGYHYFSECDREELRRISSEAGKKSGAVRRAQREVIEAEKLNRRIKHELFEDNIAEMRVMVRSMRKKINALEDFERKPTASRYTQFKSWDEIVRSK